MINNKLIKIFLLVFIATLLSTFLNGCQITPPIAEKAEWTVMVYLAAGNNLESVGIQDINEMELIGSNKDVNIIVQLDRIPFHVLDQYGMGDADDASNNNWTGTRRYYVTKDINPEIIRSNLIMDLGEKNMGDPETLNDFALWAMQNYPAKRYLLVLWNHGGGFRSIDTSSSRDICWDWNFGFNNRITMPQLKESLSFISGQMGKKIDIVGMDACYMGMVEVAYQIKDYSDIVVFSEASVPGDGWQYDCILEGLVNYPLQKTNNFASSIVDSFQKQYSGSGRNVTISAVDLSKIDNLADNISNLANAIISDNKTLKENYRAAARNTQNYTGVGFEYIDLKHFTSNLPDYTSNSSVLIYANQIKQYLEDGNIIINNTFSGSSVRNSYGLSIYFPYYSYDNYYNNLIFTQDFLWDEMLTHLGY
ncbi:MAG: clostripain-related cysteine peptidase [Atribacterota bacterium]|nr:clostripain-related cysteine peptidase [Atribacterota bacterium]